MVCVFECSLFLLTFFLCLSFFSCSVCSLLCSLQCFSPCFLVSTLFCFSHFALTFGKGNSKAQKNFWGKKMQKKTFQQQTFLLFFQLLYFVLLGCFRVLVGPEGQQKKLMHFTSFARRVLSFLEGWKEHLVHLLVMFFGDKVFGLHLSLF